MKIVWKLVSFTLCICIGVVIMQFPNLLNIQENIIATILSGTGILIGVLLNQFIFTKIDKHYNEKKKI